MKNNKAYMFIVIFNIVIFGILILYFNINKTTGEYIILPDNNVYTFQSGKLKKYEKDIKNHSIILVQEDAIKVMFSYIDGDLKFYKDGEEIETTDEFKYAYTSGIKLYENNTEIEDIDYNEYELIKKVLDAHGIDGYSYLPTASKIKFGTETIYLISNLFEEQTYDKVFSFVYYLNKNNDIIYLDEFVTSSKDAYDICVPEYNSLVTINNQQSLIINCAYFSTKGKDTKVYNRKLVQMN